MPKPALRIDEIVESETLAMTKKARELKEMGKDIISLSIGEPDFDTPEHINAAAIRAIQEHHTHYPPVLGYTDFREAICRKLRRENNLSYSIHEIIVSTGAKQSLVNLILSLVNPGDEVIIPAPYWVSYPSMVSFAGGKPVLIETKVENDFKPEIDQIRQAITPRTKVFIFSSPCNPSGTVFSRAELEVWAELFREHPDIFIISDEIYEHILFEGEHTSIASLPGFRERTAVVNGLSKGFAMTGWRIGYVAAPEWLVKACEKLQGVFTSGANTIAQKAGIAALDEDLGPSIHMRDVFLRRRNLVLQLLEGTPGMKFNIPEGAFYLFPDVSACFGRSIGGKRINNASDLVLALLEEAQVAVVSGDAFGTPECIRISFATSDHLLEEACRRIRNVFEQNFS
jgi:aspartate aminotransferase